MADYRATPRWKELGASIFEELDSEKIVQEINKDIKVPIGSWDMQSVGEMVFSAAEKWLARDCLWMQMEGVEHRFEWDGESGVYDQFGVFGDEAVDYLRGKKFVRDWKTTKSGLSEDWVQRLTDSWQWRVYLYNSGADVFVYSGVARSGDCREFYLMRPPNLEEQVRNQLLGLGMTREMLVTGGLQIYPMNRPFACNAFGRECENLHDCRNWKMPRRALPGWNWSPSSMDQFLICPERMRRSQLNKLEGKEGVSGYDAEIGSAFHRGVAEVYRQSFRLGLGDEKENS